MRAAGWIGVTALVLLASGCAHYGSSLRVSRAVVSSVPGEAALGGVELACAGAEAPLVTQWLAAASGLPDLAHELAAVDRALLLEDPLRLWRERERRLALRDRVGRRYLLVGACRESRLADVGRWDALVVIPTSAVTAAFPVSVAAWQRPEVSRATLALRLVDLESGRIEGEVLEVLRATPAEAGFTKRYVDHAVASLGLRRSGR
jgi:hypothetical protein